MPTDSPIPESLLDDRLPDWWRPLGVDIAGIVDARRKTIAEFASNLGAKDLVSAVAYAYGDTTAGAALIDRIRKLARKHDAAFAGDVRDAEPVAIVAAALAHHLAENPKHEGSTIISMLTLSAHWKRYQLAIRPLPLHEYAELQLGYAASVERESRKVAVIPSAESRVDDELNKLEEFPDGVPQLTGGQVAPHLSAHAAAVRVLARRVDLIGRRVRHEQALVREELGVQTWLLEEWCASADIAWADLSAEATPILAGVELAARTILHVPFADSSSLLASTIAKAGRDPAETLSPYQGVSATRDAASNALPPSLSERLFPLSTALGALESGAGGSDRAKALAGVRKQRALSIAEQAYREALSARVLAEADE